MRRKVRLPSEWIKLGGDVVVTVGLYRVRPRKDDNVVVTVGLPETQRPKARPTRVCRFLMLGPMGKDRTYRKTVCAGSWDGEHAHIDHGVISPERRRELERVLRERGTEAT